VLVGEERDAGHIVLDPRMKEVFTLLTQVAPTNLPVLVLGETGSGKEGAAEWLHTKSGRQSTRFVRLNCASLSETVLESELFGHERGAFTGAAGAHEGLFEAADGGTLLLDEIGELGLRAQAKLLRVLETGEIVRVGSTRPRRVDVRIVAATHRDLAAMVQRGEFREDLYYRLSGVTVTLPPLRERPSEIVPLATLFLARAARTMNRAPWMLHPDTAAALLEHPWPGNVRELRNVVTRAAALCSEMTLRPEHLVFGPKSLPHLVSVPQTAPSSTRIVEAPSSEPTMDVRCEVRAFERERIVAALRKTGGNQTEAAKLLGVSRRTLTNKLNAHGLPRPRKGASKPSPGEN
jgi:transcriptional regulator with GAF, ATPase, and Fis domain